MPRCGVFRTRADPAEEQRDPVARLVGEPHALGLWLVVWLVLALLRRERRALLTVDAFGNVQSQKV